MELTNKFTLLKSFLHQHRELYSDEVMDQYPYQTNNTYHRWASELSHLSDEDKIIFENEGNLPIGVSSDFCHFMHEVLNLKNIPTINCHYQLKQNLRKINIKKRHEIENIISLIKNGAKIFSHVVDIGGGMGHLAQALIGEFASLNVSSIDQNEKLQITGKKAIQKWNPSVSKRLTYINKHINEQNNDIDQINQCALLIGLHTCGPLAYHLLNEFGHNKYAGLLSFACCYHKLLNDDYNISQLAQIRPLTFSNEALTLASKCHKPIDQKSLNERLKLKTYRYGLHFFMSDHGMWPPKSIGNIKTLDLNLEFAEFCHKYVPKTHNIDSNILNGYIQNTATQKKIAHALLLGQIRSHMGRLIEIYLAYDRAIYLNEQGHNAKLAQIFSPHLSPRNIGIYIL